jgi:hypothetical protein
MQALEPTQAHVQWIQKVLFLAIKQLGLKLPTHPHLVSRLRMSGAVHPLPAHTIVWTETNILLTV